MASPHTETTSISGLCSQSPIDKLHTLKYLKISPKRNVKRRTAVKPTSDLRRSRSKLIYLQTGNSPQQHSPSPPLQKRHEHKKTGYKTREWVNSVKPDSRLCTDWRLAINLFKSQSLLTLSTLLTFDLPLAREICMAAYRPCSSQHNPKLSNSSGSFLGRHFYVSDRVHFKKCSTIK